MTTFKLIAPLHDYQRRAGRHVLAGRGNALFLEMGLGKTLTTLEVLRHRMHHGRTSKTLLLAPRRICEQVWRQEVTRWNLDICVEFLNGGPKQRIKAIEAGKADVYLLTYENLSWLEETGLFPWDTVVLDELSKMKNSGSKRWRAFKRMIKKHEPWTLGLTGTPAPNGYVDLWAQMYCLDRGATLGEVKGTYLTKYFNNISRDPRRYARWVLKPGAKEQIDLKLKRAGVLSMRARDVLDQPLPIRLPDLRITLPTAAAETYRELETELLATMPSGQVILPDHEGVIQLKLRQLSSGFMIDEDKRPHRLHTAKVDALKEYVESMAGEPFLLVYTFQEELAMIQEALGGVPYLGGGVNEWHANQAITRWNRGDLPVLPIQPQSGGHGLNLQDGGHHILFYSTDWNLETYQQVVARLDRQGQESPVFVRHMSAGGVETDIHDRLGEKAGLQDHLMDALSA